mmetsp:Transcript_84595/g.262753  ORF Transcript_84595/g.262753 Transcript_84595/m.262753 type:complete len:132 (+) Transcript_84595:454-849(+)
MKSFQHRRVQGLDAQVQKLEKQRRKLEAEQEKRLRSEQASKAAEAVSAENQHMRLQQLNSRLTAQVEEAQRERIAKEEKQLELREEKERLCCGRSGRPRSSARRTRSSTRWPRARAPSGGSPGSSATRRSS